MNSFDTNISPSPMLAICGWSSVAQITGGKWTQNANSPWVTSGSPHTAPLGGPLSSHTISLCAAGMMGGFSARSRDAALPLVCLCLPHAWYSSFDLHICKCCSSTQCPILPMLFFLVSLHCGVMAVRTRPAVLHGFIFRRSEAINYQIDWQFYTWRREMACVKNDATMKLSSPKYSRWLYFFRYPRSFCFYLTCIDLWLQEPTLRAQLSSRTEAVDTRLHICIKSDCKGVIYWGDKGVITPQKSDPANITLQ